MINIFFSYSHTDETLRNELDKHLSILRNQGVINMWHDRCLLPGAEFDGEISIHMKSANVILLLVSSDFLASNYCYNVEMKYAMAMHNKKEAVVLPVILRPCAWHDAPFGKLLASPKDGKPVMKYTLLDDAFLEITNGIKSLANVLPPAKSTTFTESPVSHMVQPEIRSSNLRIKKTFSDAERDFFLDEAFEYIAKFFEGSLIELKTRNIGLEYRFKRVDSQTFNASVYINGKTKSECTIFYGSGSLFRQSKSISYVYGITDSKNSLNESISVNDDGYQLYLTQLGMSNILQASKMLTFEGAAEFFWQMFIQRLQS